MVRTAGGLLLLLVLPLAGSAFAAPQVEVNEASTVPRGEFREALSAGHYPWYDANNDTLKRVEPPSNRSWWDWVPDWKWKFGRSATSPSINLGNILVILALALLLGLLVGGLIWAYRRYIPSEDAKRLPRFGGVGAASRTGALPAGLPSDLVDPLGVARRLRDQGDLAGAILCLFVHQILSLEKLRLLRLAPGRTARQLVRSVSDAWVRSRVEPSLRLFEISYYGHHEIELAAFDHAWNRAMELESRIAEGALT